MRTTWPAFRMLTFVTSASEQKSTKTQEIDKLLIFVIDNRYKNGVKIDDYTTVTEKPKLTYYVGSSNGYGLPVRPIRD